MGQSTEDHLGLFGRAYPSSSSLQYLELPELVLVSFWSEREREMASCDNAQDCIETGAVLGGEVFVYSIWICFGQFVYADSFLILYCRQYLLGKQCINYVFLIYCA